MHCLVFTSSACSFQNFFLCRFICSMLCPGSTAPNFQYCREKYCKTHCPHVLSRILIYPFTIPLSRYILAHLTTKRSHTHRLVMPAGCLEHQLNYIYSRKSSLDGLDGEQLKLLYAPVKAHDRQRLLYVEWWIVPISGEMPHGLFFHHPPSPY